MGLGCGLRRWWRACTVKWIFLQGKERRVCGLEVADEAAAPQRLRLHGRGDRGQGRPAPERRRGLYQFAFPRPTPVPSHTLVVYRALLLLASLQTAAACFLDFPIKAGILLLKPETFWF